MTALWDTFVSGTNYQRWLDYHRRCLRSHYGNDDFGRRSQALQEEDDLLSSACVFRLGRKFTTIFESKPRVEKTCINWLLPRACEFGDLDIARLLLDVGANASAADGDGWTALHRASWEGHEAVARLLVGAGTDVSVVDKDDWTALHWASEKEHEAVARLLVEAGAGASAATRGGWTPLHWASEEGHEAMARLLVEAGADASVTDGVGGRRWTGPR